MSSVSNVSIFRSRFSSEDCIYTFSLKPDEDPDIITYVKLEVDHFFLGRIGSMLFVSIKRNTFKTDGGFCLFMEDHHQLLSKFCSAFFDDYGRVRIGTLSGKFANCGTGVWGNEWDQGKIVFVLDMDVKEQYRSKGVGAMMLKQVMQSDFVTEVDNVACLPEPLKVPGLRHDDFDTAKARQIAFFSKNGFRRMARTAFFGYTTNPGHPSRWLDVEADADGV